MCPTPTGALQNSAVERQGTPSVPRAPRIAHAIETADTHATNSKRAAAWRLWSRHTASIGIPSPLLQFVSRKQRLQACESFCDALRHGELGKDKEATIQSGTIRNSIAQINATFRNNEIHPPFLDKSGKLRHSISKLLKSYANSDPPRNCQPALPQAFFAKVMQDLTVMRTIGCDYGIALCELTCLASFFGMRSVEYCKTKDPKPKTKRVTLQDIRFLHTQPKNLLASNAAKVSINFADQKNGIKHQKITRPRASPNGLQGYCPVTIAASLYNRVGSYAYECKNPPINLCVKDGWHHLITYQEVVKYQKHVAAVLGERLIGFPPSKIGTHSMRVTFATCLYEAGFSDAVIKSEGRWKSDAFLRYIRLNSTRQNYNITQALVHQAP